MNFNNISISVIDIFFTLCKSILEPHKFAHQNLM